MATTPALQATYKGLQEMDAQIADAEAHLRVLKAAQFPGAIKLESDLAKAKVARQDLLRALEQEMERS